PPPTSTLFPYTTLFRSALSRYRPIGTPFPSTTIMTLVPLSTLVFPIPFPLFWQEQIDHPEKLEPIRFSLPHPFDLTAHAKSAPTDRKSTRLNSSHVKIS